MMVFVRFCTSLLLFDARFQVLGSGANHFRTRSPQPVEWRELEVSAGGTRIIKSMTGVALPGRLLAVIGASGSGKSTLLAGLSGSTLPGRTVTGAVRFVTRRGDEEESSLSEEDEGDQHMVTDKDTQGSGNSAGGDDTYDVTDNKSHPSDGISPGACVVSVESGSVGLLPQEAEFFSFLTVHETLVTTAALQLPDWTEEARLLAVNGVIQKLGLAHVQHHQIGGGGGGGGRKQHQRQQQRGRVDRREINRSSGGRRSGGGGVGGGGRGGLSGGEKRRLSVAIELLRSAGGPLKLLVADEPTSGLDAFTAHTVLKLMKTFAVEQQVPVVVSLHQPSSNIWNHLLDDVLLLTPSGRVAYHGPANKAVEYFEARRTQRELQLQLQLQQRRQNLQQHQLQQQQLQPSPPEVVSPRSPLPPPSSLHQVRLRCPCDTNPAEWLVDLVSIDYGCGSTTESEDELRCEVIAETWKNLQQPSRPPPLLQPLPQPAVKQRQRLFLSSSSQQQQQQQKGEQETRSGKKTATISSSRSKSKWLFQRRRLRRLQIPLGQRLQRVKQRLVCLATRMGCLVTRSTRETTRNRAVNGVRLGVSVGLVWVFGAVFGTLGPTITPTDAAERISLISFAAINIAMMGATKALGCFGKEAAAVRRERLQGLYSGGEYLLAKAMVELPLDALLSSSFAFLLHKRCALRQSAPRLASTLALLAVASSSLGFAVGACTPSPETALAVGTPLMIVLMILGVRNPSGVDPSKVLPLPLRLLSMISPVRWGIDALAISELQGAKLALFKTTPPPHPPLPHQTKDSETPLGNYFLLGRQRQHLRSLLSCYLSCWRRWRSLFRGSPLSLGMLSTKVSTGDEVLRRLGIFSTTTSRDSSSRGSRSRSRSSSKDGQGTRRDEGRSTVQKLLGQEHGNGNDSSCGDTNPSFDPSWPRAMWSLAAVSAVELLLAAVALSTLQRPRVVVAAAVTTRTTSASSPLFPL